jgi:hypothetical protein
LHFKNRNFSEINVHGLKKSESLPHDKRPFVLAFSSCSVGSGIIIHELGLMVVWIIYLAVEISIGNIPCSQNYSIGFRNCQ